MSSPDLNPLEFTREDIEPWRIMGAVVIFFLRQLFKDNLPHFFSFSFFFTHLYQAILSLLYAYNREFCMFLHCLDHSNLFCAPKMVLGLTKMYEQIKVMFSDEHLP